MLANASFLLCFSARQNGILQVCPAGGFPILHWTLLVCFMHRGQFHSQGQLWSKTSTCAFWCPHWSWSCLLIYYVNVKHSSLLDFCLVVCRQMVRSAEKRSGGAVPSGQHLCWIQHWGRWHHDCLFQGSCNSFRVSETLTVILLKTNLNQLKLVCLE